MKLLREEVLGGVLELLSETFQQTHGHYLDKNTDLLHSLADLNAQEASTAIPGGSSIIAHVYHLLFYLEAIQGFMDKSRAEKVDWPATWQVQQLDEAGWQQLKERLQEGYQQTASFIKNLPLNDVDEFSGALDLVTHSSYHLGAIRQILLFSKSQT